MEHPDGRRIVFPFHNEVDRYVKRSASGCGHPSEGFSRPS
jgi:hypothetical protein